MLANTSPGARSKMDRAEGTRVESPFTMATFRHLPDDRILAIHTAAVELQLAAQQDALLAGLPGSYVATLPSQGTPSARFLHVLRSLNAVTALTDGIVPLVIWLRNAAALTAARPEGRLFETALSHVDARFRA